MKTKVFVLVTLISLLFTGCQPPTSLDRSPTSATAFNWERGTALVPGNRSGYSRQGVSFRNFSVNSDNGIYYISSADPFLLYIDDDANDMIPVCNRPDCLHAAQDFSKYTSCNAYFPALYGITSIDNKLFIAHGSATELLVVDCIDSDGSNRKTVATLSSLLGAYDALASVSLWNGLLLFGVSGSDGDGGWKDQFYYYKLDGTMQDPQPCEPMGIMGSDAENWIGYTTVNGKTTVHEWNPNTNSVNVLSEDFGYGYYGTEYAIIMDEGKVTKYTYSDQSKTILVNSVFTGECSVHVFPDCLIVNCKDDSGQQTLYFYNWEFKDIGKLILDFPLEVPPSSVICGETKSSIFLTEDWNHLPEYRIDKSSLGTESIKLISLELPYLPSLNNNS